MKILHDEKYYKLKINPFIPKFKIFVPEGM